MELLGPNSMSDDQYVGSERKDAVLVYPAIKMLNYSPCPCKEKGYMLHINLSCHLQTRD